jgi:PIN domain nuclease of toxin-antitoxin system
VKVLTDTHTLVWALSKPEELGTEVREALATLPFTASVANLWELVLKARKPDALLADPLPWWNEYVTPARARSCTSLRQCPRSSRKWLLRR